MGRRQNDKGELVYFVTRRRPTADEFRSEFDVVDAACVPDYDDSSRDYTDGEGALAFVSSPICIRIVSVKRVVGGLHFKLGVRLRSGRQINAAPSPHHL